MRTPFVLLFGIVIALLASVIIESPVTASSTVSTTDTATSVVTGAGVTTGTLTLAKKHWYNTNKDLTISCATDGDVSSGATISSDRRTVSLTALTAGTTQNCTPTYLAEISDTTISIVLKIVPFLLMVGALLSSFGSVFVGARAGMGGGFGMGALSTVILVFIGVVLIPIVLSFSDLVSEAYSIAPEYIGVTAILPLVSIGYVLSLLGTAFGGLSPSVKNVFGQN
tara:strand:+ start:16929 stop:17603 length:675 start_codon:yes stop_codon:yes gene_type:complete